MSDAVATVTPPATDVAAGSASPTQTTPTTAAQTTPTTAKRRKADSTTTTTPTSTTAVATTTTVPLPRPVSPPEDFESPEPVVPLGTLAIPAIGIERTYYEGIRIPTFDLGPGHWPGTASAGQRGNMVLGGHRTDSNEDFRDLDQLAPGDEMIVTTNDGASFTYVVESTEITDPYAIRVIRQTPRKTATLFACHPPGSVSQRIVVHLVLAP